MNKRVLLIDDHPAIRMAVRILLQEEGYTVIGEVDDGAIALRTIQELKPDIIILDIGLPTMDGLTIISRLISQHITLKIIVLTAQESDHIAIRCLQAGAQGYVNKNNELSELIKAVHMVNSGYHCFPEHINSLIRRNESRDNEHVLLASLSTRELGVLQQLSLGMSNKQISERMQLSCKTISTYKTRLLLKLNAHNLLDLYDLARRNGLTDN